MSYIFVTAMLWSKTSRPAPGVSTLVPFIKHGSHDTLTGSEASVAMMRHLLMQCAVLDEEK